MSKTFSLGESRKLYNRYQQLTRQLSSCASLETNLKGEIIRLSNKMQNELIMDTLRLVPIEELNKDHNGFRIKTLKDHGIEDMALLASVSEKRLSDIEGISADGARSMKLALQKMIVDMKETTSISISYDHKTTESSLLVARLDLLNQMLPHLQEIYELNGRYSEMLEICMRDLKPATNPVTWMFAGFGKRNDAYKAFDQVSIILENKYGPQMQSHLSAVRSLSHRLDNQQAWNHFKENPIEFYNLLESINPTVLSGGNQLNGLPEQLAQAIMEQPVNLDGLNCTLRKYQLWGVKYILHQKRVLLGDEMGLGKTIQALASMVSLANEGRRHFLVICPASVMENWYREVTSKSILPAIKIHGNDKGEEIQQWIRDGGVGITTYETTGHLKFRDGFIVDMLVVDEAHFVKNPSAQRSQNVKRIIENCDHILFMTGTALENRVSEMVSLISMLRKDIADKVSMISALAAANKFKSEIAPVYYRRKREDVLGELPELIESKEWCIMGQKEHLAYYQSIKDKQFSKARRVSWDVALDDSSKAARLLDIVEEAKSEDRKVIVFSYFLETLNQVVKLLGNQCMMPITGSISPDKRQKIIDGFSQAEAGKVLPAQIVSGGTGLNIQSASVIVICEPQLKPSLENQAISRAYRMGQSRNVIVYRLLCEDSIDERITNLLAQKQLIFNEFADRSEVGQACLSLEIDDATFAQLMKEEEKQLEDNLGIS